MVAPLTRMAEFLHRVGTFTARRKWLVLGAWVVLTIVLIFFFRTFGATTSNNLRLPGTDSQAATDLLAQRFPPQQNGSNPLIFHTRTGKVTDASNKQAIEASYRKARKLPHVAQAVDPFSKQGASQISKDKRTAFIPVLLDVSGSDLTDQIAQSVLNAGDPGRAAGMQVALGGSAGSELSDPATESSEVVGLAAAMIILAFTFGTLVAMGLPIVSAVIGLIAGLSIIGLLGHVVSVPTIGPTLATMIGLGVGIDYALFIVTRHKLQLRDGMELHESIARAAATAGGAVVFAGTTVVIALCSLAFAGIPLATTLGFTAAIAVVVAVLAATTLLPALLGALGPRINSLRVKLGRTHPDDHRPHGWARWARGVADRPWRSLVASVGVLLVLAIPVL